MEVECYRDYEQSDIIDDGIQQRYGTIVFQAYITAQLSIMLTYFDQLPYVAQHPFAEEPPIPTNPLCQITLYDPLYHEMSCIEAMSLSSIIEFKCRGVLTIKYCETNPNLLMNNKKFGLLITSSCLC